MSERQVFMGPLTRESYDNEAVARALPMLFEVGDSCRLRIDIEAFPESAEVPGIPSVAEAVMVIKAKLQNSGRWSLLVLNREPSVDTIEEPLTDHYATFDADGILRRLDSYPVEGDLLRSLDYAQSRHLANDVPGGYILTPVGVTLAQHELDSPIGDLDSEFADLLSSS